jgi:nucleoside-diphosphate-sugar epimerase
MRILIIGGTGFIGPAVVTQLHGAGHEVIVNHRGVHEAELPEGVVHIHTPLRQALPLLQDKPIEAAIFMIPMGEHDTHAVIEVLRGHTPRLICLSSIDVYRAYGRIQGTEPGEPDPTPLTEDSPLRDQLYPYRTEPRRPQGDPMAWADQYDKILMERELMGAEGLLGTVLRLPMVYGPRDGQHRLWQYLGPMQDDPEGLQVPADEALWRCSRTYVDNAAAAIALVATNERAAGRIYNVAEPEALTELEWAREIATASGWQGEILLTGDTGSGPSPAQMLTIDSTRIRSELAYVEVVGRAEALHRAVEWELANPLT